MARDTLYSICALVSLVAALQLAGCSRKHPIFGCACGADAECTDGNVCDNCGCHPPCTSNADCISAKLPNCDPDAGHCMAKCQSADDCPATQPNCGSDGLCFALCTGHADCTNPDFPNCDLDPGSTTAGLCQKPCGDNGDCPSAYPNCDTASGTCEPACVNNDDCFASAPNCDANSGLCYGPCGDNTGCPVSSAPVCDPASGLCQGPCPATACPSATPRCDDSGSGLCLPACQKNNDCSASAPNCNTVTGLCYGACASGVDCAADAPNCDSATGLCAPPCSTSADCPDAALPNCGSDGVCFGPCADHPDCKNVAYPNCDLDSGSVTAGTCLPPCTDNSDCTSSLYPNCDTVLGTCFAPCGADGDCPNGGICGFVGAGLCSAPQCTGDNDCNPPSTVCETGRCVVGCTSHTDCAASERCRLITAPLYHCEARDCTADANCTPPSTVCDTDGGANPTGGGYCVSGCSSYDDCPLGYDCTAATGACSVHDYGDVGSPCTSNSDCSNCNSGQGIDDGSGTMVCTALCCTQHDCPADYACRPVTDGAGGAIDACQPLEGNNQNGRRGTACGQNSDCRSNVCMGTCLDTCCTDKNCDSAAACQTAGSGVTACQSGPQTDDLGALGCMTGSTSCNARMCFALWQPGPQASGNACDPASGGTSTCPPYYDNACVDFAGSSVADGIDDCVYDFCLAPCCKTSDCASSVTGDSFFCGSALFSSAGDMDVCLANSSGSTSADNNKSCTGNTAATDCPSKLCSAAGSNTGVCLPRLDTGAGCSDDAQCISAMCDPGTGKCLARLAEGGTCTQATQCQSNFCTVGKCRERCCTDADCTDVSYPHCQVENLPVYGQVRALTVCVP